VFGMVQRGGRTRAMVTPDVSATTLRGNIKQLVLPGTMVYTDEFVQYRKLGREGFQHRPLHDSVRVFFKANNEWRGPQLGAGGDGHADVAFRPVCGTP
jgi:transposase-like protein